MTDNPIIENETRDRFFDPDQADVLYDAYLILYGYGYTHEDLAPLRHLIVHTTHYDGYSLVKACEMMPDE